MIVAEPGDNGGLEFAGEVAEFTGLGLADGADGIVFGGVALGAASIEVVGIVGELGAQYDGQGLKRAVVGEVFLGAITTGIEQDGAELEGGVVGDAELPVGRKITCRVHQVTFDDGQQIGDLLGSSLVWAEPAVSRPLLQAHRDLLSTRFWVR